MSLFPYISLFSSTLVLGSILALRGNHWIFIWMGLELNLISFIPLLTSSQSNQESEAAIKYFLAQSLGRGLLLLRSLSFLANDTGFINKDWFYLLLLTSLLIKLGLPPCHFWFPSVISSISWPLCIILATWQKIVPVILLFYSFSAKLGTLRFIVISLRSLVGGLGGLNQTQLRPLLAYSSIGHISWILGARLISFWGGVVYFFIYIIISLPIIFILWSSSSLINSSLNSFSLKSIKLNFLFVPLIISLGGIPPFTGFFPKWIVLELLSPLSAFLVIVLLFGSIINLYYYLNLSFISILKSKKPINLKVSDSSRAPLFLILISSLSLGVIPILILL